MDEAKEAAATIDGRNGAWSLPLQLPTRIEPLAPLQAIGDEASRHEAAYELVRNYENVVRFAARGAGEPGAKQFQAPLADPYAAPADDFLEPVDVCLRHVTVALLDGADSVSAPPIPVHGI